MNILCPGCRDEQRPVERDSPCFPFCSSECRDSDLSGWIEERYRIPGKTVRQGETEEEGKPQDGA
ncbi:MAG: DNA gyrase inhibitor YacG [Planctomycetota bacterium]